MGPLGQITASSEESTQPMRRRLPWAARFSRVLLVIVGGAALAACEGPTGPEGPGGDPGDPGDPGADGLPGDNGNDGDQGNPGEDGEDGRDSYLTGPGLVIDVTSASIAADGTVTAFVTITDGEGTPLDRNGEFTEGAITPSMMIARLPRSGGEAAQYVSYNVRNVTSTITGLTMTQATSDSNGTWEEIGVAEGTYKYTFSTHVTPTDTTETHTIGAWGRRTFDEVQYGDDDLYDFVPSGAAVMKREVVQAAACANCHDDLSAHGGSRKTVQLCVMCHTPQTGDPDTGNTVDMKVMAHKIHRGHNLPSVQAEVPYQFIRVSSGQQFVNDFSTVAFPQAVNNCGTCHDGGSQSDNWNTNPTAAACGSCHDNIVWADQTAESYQSYHPGGYSTTAPCATCHGPDTGLEPIITLHAEAIYDPQYTPELTLISITNTAVGQQPTIRFQVKVNGQPRDILTQPLSGITAVFAGPNTDFATFWNTTLAAANVVAVDASQGIFDWTVPASAAIKAGSSGSYTVGLQGHIVPPGEAEGASARTVTMPFYVGGGQTPVARRHVVAAEKCDSCHKKLAFHGSGARNDPNFCVMCHNPNNVNDERAPRWESAEQYVYSVSLGNMVHRIHMGEDLTQSYVLGAFPAPNAGPNPGPEGTPIDFGEVRYPSARNNCEKCHDGETYTLPLPQGLLPSWDEIRTCTEDPITDGDSLCATANYVVLDPVNDRFPMYPAAAACVGCHDSPDAVAHTQIMTTVTGGESCAVCHGDGDEWAVAKVHGF